MTLYFSLMFLLDNRFNASNSQKVIVNQLNLPEKNMMCCVNLLLIHALRTGVLEATSYENILEKARVRHDKLILWAKPSRPVVSAYTGPGTQLAVDKPAMARQINTNLQAMADIAGVLDHVVSHDLRRGAARDFAYLPNSGGMTASMTTAGAHLRHSEMSREKSLTIKYVGHQRGSTIAARLEASKDTDTDNFSLNFAHRPFKRKKATKEETDSWMQQKGIYSTEYRVRQRAGKAMKKEARQSWAESAWANGDQQALRPQTESQINATAPSSKEKHVSSAEVTDQNLEVIDPALLTEVFTLNLIQPRRNSLLTTCFALYIL